MGTKAVGQEPRKLKPGDYKEFMHEEKKVQVEEKPTKKKKKKTESSWRDKHAHHGPVRGNDRPSQELIKYTDEGMPEAHYEEYDETQQQQP